MKFLISLTILWLAFTGGVSAQAPASASPFEQQLQRIVISHVEFRSTTVSDAVEYLRQEGARIGGTPVNIFLEGHPEELARTRISLTLDHIPLSTALRYIAEAARLDVQVQQYAVLLKEKQPGSPVGAQSTSPSLAPDAFARAVQESKDRANAKYPALKQGGTALYQKAMATLQQWRQSYPDFFKSTTWPEQLADACSDDLMKNPPLYSAEDIKVAWRSRMPHPSSLDQNYWAVTNENNTFLAALGSGQLNGEAQDQADALNISLLSKAGRFKEVEVLQQNRAQYQQRLADAAAAADRQAALDQQAQANAAMIAEVQQLRSQAAAAQAAAEQARQEAWAASVRAQQGW